MKNKANAREWHQHRQAQKQAEEDREQQSELLRYAAVKHEMHRSLDPDVFDKLGHPQVAALIRQAYTTLEEAYYLYEKEVVK